MTKMEEELFTLKWNNHQKAFLQIIRSLRSKNSHTDATIACEGKFFSVHKFVLSTCSAYFGEIFEKISCKNPVVILKDIDCKNLEYILDYMYIGEVNVRQTELASLVSVAECLQIKGLAIPDEVTEQSSKLSSNYSENLSSEIKPHENQKKSVDSTYDNETKFSTVAEHDLVKSGIKFEPKQESPTFLDADDSNNLEMTSSFDIRNGSALEAENNVTDYYPLNENAVEINEEQRSINVAGPSTLPQQIQSSGLDINLITDMSECGSAGIANEHSRFEPSLLLASHHISSRGYGLKRLKKRLSQLRAGKSNFPRSKSKVNYICPHCPYTCQDNSNFKRHVQVHTGEKPYHCPFCRYNTIHSSNLKTHMRTKHPNELVNQPLSLEYSSLTKRRDESFVSGVPPPVISQSVPPSI